MQELHIQNSLTREKEKFKPIKDGFVGIYVCGPTVYGDPHLGHAKSYVSFDVVVRYLRFLGYRVRYVQNITDVGHLTDDADGGEDKLEKQAQIEKLEPMEVAEKYTYNFFRDMDKLGVQRPDISPRASGHIPEQIEMIRSLVEKGHAYEVNGNVYFDVSSAEGYGKLSGRDLEAQESGGRIETADDKRDPKDFALWKKADSGHIMQWDSPWSRGYPGWHLECSAMANKYLGNHFDIHGGGLDNIFPHHECEIAQSECAHDESFANYWIHNNMITLNGQKMGKSLGNAISLDQFFHGNHDLLTRAWDPLVIRFFLLQSHYRSTTDFTEEALGSAEQGLQNLHDMLRTIEGAEDGTGGPYNLDSLRSELTSRMNDDFNTARTIALLFEELKKLRKRINADDAPSNLVETGAFIKEFIDGVLGIWPGEEERSSDNKTGELVQLLIDLRNKARASKNFDQADAIRDRLKAIGIELMDNTEGTTFKINSSGKTALQKEAVKQDA